MIFIAYEGYAGQQSASIKVANLSYQHKIFLLWCYRQCWRVTMEMLKLLATAAVLLALTPQRVDSTTTAISHSKGHVLTKVGCSTNWWTRSEPLLHYVTNIPEM